MRNVLILGAGQVGTFACRSIADEGGTVVAADLAPAPGYFARFGPTGSAALIRGDIRNAAEIDALIQTYAVEAIVLCAGAVGVACERDADAAWQVNVDGTRQVAQAALRNGVRRHIDPQSEYGRTKAAAEKELCSFRKEGLDVRILRPCGIYGPLRLGTGSHSARFVEAVLFGAVNDRVVTIEASPTTSDEYLYVKDLGRAIALATLRDTDSPEFVFNVGSGSKTTAEDLRSALQQVVPGARVASKIAANGADEPMPPLDVSRIKKTFGFAPRYGLVEGLGDYLQEMGWKR
jgi:nucleoside-diphosphate-sugar epimerase